MPRDAGTERVMPMPDGRTTDGVYAATVDLDGQRVAIVAEGSGFGSTDVGELRSGAVGVLDPNRSRPPCGLMASFGLAFAGPHRLLTNMGDLTVWDLASGEPTRLRPARRTGRGPFA